MVMKGYFDDMEETSLRIQDGWYETGDMGLMDEEGYLWHRGRLKRFVKIGGEMVSLVRVETVLLEICCPRAIDCCVVEVPDSLKGARIVAAVTKRSTNAKLLKDMAEQLPAIALPKQFVVMERVAQDGQRQDRFPHHHRAGPPALAEAGGLSILPLG